MAVTTHRRGPRSPRRPLAPDPGAPINWEAAERSSEFKELVAKRRRFVLPATVFFFAWYFGFIVLAGYAEGFMGESIYQGLTVGYALALTQFVMVWGLGWLYLRRSDRDFDPLRERAAAKALDVAAESGRDVPRPMVDVPPENAPLPPRSPGEVRS